MNESDRQPPISSTHFLVMSCAVIEPLVSRWLVYCLIMNMKPQFVGSYSYEYQISYGMVCHALRRLLLCFAFVHQSPIKLLRLDVCCWCCEPLHIISSYCGLAFVFDVLLFVCTPIINLFFFYLFMTTMKRKATCLFQFFVFFFGVSFFWNLLKYHAHSHI